VRQSAGTKESAHQLATMSPHTTFLDDVVHSAALRRDEHESEHIWRAPSSMHDKTGTEMHASTGVATVSEHEHKEDGTVVPPMRMRGGRRLSQGQTDTNHGRRRMNVVNACGSGRSLSASASLLLVDQTSTRKRSKKPWNTHPSMVSGGLERKKSGWM